MIPPVFQAGQFQTFYATRRIHLGRIAREVEKGDPIEYDGTTLRINGSPTEYPEFRATLKTNWFDTSPPVFGAKRVPTAAEARTIMPTSREEEAVSKVAPTKKDTVAPKEFSSTIVKMDDGDHVMVKNFAAKTAGTTDVGGEESGEVVGSFPSAKQTFVVEPEGTTTTKPFNRMTVETETDDSRSVGKIGVPATSRATVTDSSKVSRQIQDIERPKATKTASVNVIATPDGNVHAAEADSVEAILGALDPESHAALMAKQRKAALAASQAKESPKVEAPVSPPVDPPKLKVKHPKTVVEAVITGDDIEIAPGLTWNKAHHWKTRVKLAIQGYGADPESLELICAYEDPSVAKFIREALARRTASAGGGTDSGQ